MATDINVKVGLRFVDHVLVVDRWQMKSMWKWDCAVDIMVASFWVVGEKKSMRRTDCIADIMVDQVSLIDGDGNQYEGRIALRKSHRGHDRCRSNDGLSMAMAI